MKTAYAVIAERYSDLTYYASVFRIEAGRNIYNDCLHNGDMISLTLCESKKEAQMTGIKHGEKTVHLLRSRH